VPKLEAERRHLLHHLPLTWTSLLVACVTFVAIALVAGMALTAAPGRRADSPVIHASDSRGPDLLTHPQETVVTTTTPPTTEPPPTTAPPETTTPTTTPRAVAPPTTTPVQSPAHTAPAAPGAGGLLPPRNPPANIAPAPDFTGACEQGNADSSACIAAADQAMAAARATEGLGPVVLPSDYASLTAGEQLFVLTDIERVDRGLPPVVGMVQELDQDAQTAASGNTDPTPSALPPGTSALQWASNWAEATGPMGADYSWMYEDGPGSGNTACGSSGGGCWGHRDNILGFGSSSGGVLVMGAAEATVAGDSPWSSDCELIAVLTGSPSFTYTWAQAQAAGAR
jgi:hypothetical protein